MLHTHFEPVCIRLVGWKFSAWRRWLTHPGPAC